MDELRCVNDDPFQFLTWFVDYDVRFCSTTYDTDVLSFEMENKPAISCLKRTILDGTRGPSRPLVDCASPRTTREAKAPNVVGADLYDSRLAMCFEKSLS